MQMLYRLSYVGLIDRDVRTGSVAAAVTQVMSAAPDWKTWLSVLAEKTHAPAATLSL